MHFWLCTTILQLDNTKDSSLMPKDSALMPKDSSLISKFSWVCVWGVCVCVSVCVYVCVWCDYIIQWRCFKHHPKQPEVCGGNWEEFEGEKDEP